MNGSLFITLFQKNAVVLLAVSFSCGLAVAENILEMGQGSTFDGADRTYQRTERGDFADRSFQAETTVTIPTGKGPLACAFFGLGRRQASPQVFQEPADQPALYLRICPGDFADGQLTAGSTSSPGPGSGTHKVRLTWDAVTKRALFNGVLVVNGGTLAFTGGGSVNNVSGITIANGAKAQFSGNANSNPIGAANLPITVNAGGTLEVTTSNSMGYPAQGNYANVTLNGGTMALPAYQYVNKVTLNGGTVSGAGALQFWYPVTNAIDCTASAMISSALIFNSSAQTISTGSGATLTVSGAIYAGPGFTKSGTGTLLLNQSSPTVGPVTVSNGTLGGTGSLGGAVTVQSGGTLSPGTSGTGTFTVNNTLALAGITAMEIGRTGSNLTTDKVAGISTVTYGGSLVVTKIGATALAAGDAFQLFGATTYTGTFSSITLPTLSSGLIWNASRLWVDGTLVVQNGVPAGWTSADIGSTGIPGNTQYDGVAYTVTGAGGGVTGTADAFQSASQTLAGDGEIRARLTSQTNQPSALAGVMMRAGSAADAVNASLGLVPGSGFVLRARSTTGAASTQIATASANVAPNNWVRLTRSGTLVTGYVSADGTTWTKVGQVNLTAMTGGVFTGLAVTSSNVTVAGTAVFDNVALTPFPSPWQTGDIGTTLVGKAEYYNGVHTVTGAGADIYGTADGFRFVRQALSGNGEIIARVASVQNTNAWAKAGVMIRDSLSAGSKNAMMEVSGGAGQCCFQYRSSTSGTTNASAQLAGSAPRWVKLTRVGNVLTGSVSTNGTTWTQVGTATVSMASQIYIGLAVTSHDNSQNCDAVFDNVTVTP